MSGGDDTFTTQCNVTLDGDMKFAAFTVSSGDTLDLNGQRIETSDKLDIVGTLTDGGDKSLAVCNNIDTTGTGRNISGESDLILNGSGNVYWGATGGGWNTTFFNGGAYDTWAGQNVFGTTLIGSGDLDVLHDTTFNNIKVATGGELDGNSSTLTATGDFNAAGGLIGKSALSLNGSSDYVDCGTDTSLDLVNAITLEAWVKAEGSESYPRIVSKQAVTGRSTNESCYQLGLREGATAGPRFSVGGVFDIYSGSEAATTDNTDFGDIVDGKWHHLVGTYDKVNTRMYLDGKKIYDSTANTAVIRTNSSEPLTIGVSEFDDVKEYYYDGLLGRVSIWSVALTQTQIRDMMFKNYTDATTTNCVAWYQFDEGTGVDVADSTTTNDGTYNGAWAGAGTFTYGTSTLVMSGTGTLDMKYPLNLVYNLTVSGTTTIKNTGDPSGVIDVKGATCNIAGTLLSSSSEALRLYGSTPTSDNITLSLGNAATSIPDLHVLYAYAGGTTTLPALTTKRIFVNGAIALLSGDATITEELQVASNATFKPNGNTTTSKLVDLNGTATLNLQNSSTLILSNTSGLTSESGVTLLAGPGCVISGTSAATTFKSQNDWSVVGKVENLNVTNEELKVTGQVINCTGDIIQQHPSQDANQQLDYDTADDRDIQFGVPDLDKNTELVT